MDITDIIVILHRGWSKAHHVIVIVVKTDNHEEVQTKKSASLLKDKRYLLFVALPSNSEFEGYIRLIT